jgi:hypothetical protein
MTFTNLIITKLTSPGTTKQVTIPIERDVENITKSVTVIPFPKSTKEYPVNGGTGNITKIIDLLKIEERLTINGYLVSGTYTSDSSTTSQGRKSDLKLISKAGGVVSITYEGETFNAAIDKVDIERVTSDGIEVNDNEAGYSVIITFVRGEDLL